MKLSSRKYMKVFALLCLFEFSFYSCSENSSNEKSLSANLASDKVNLNVNGQIFMGDLKVKNRNKGRTKTKIHSIQPSSLFTEKTSRGDPNDVQFYAGSPENDRSQNVGPGPIYHEAWLKYFKYTDLDTEGNNTPRKFFVNTDFRVQERMFRNADLKQTRDGQMEYIKDRGSFYGVLFGKSLNILTSRQSELQRTFDTINLNFMPNITEGVDTLTEPTAAIMDFGNFKEGYCFKLLTTMPKRTFWVICLDSLEEKEKMIRMITKLKIQLQRENGLINVNSAEEAKRIQQGTLAELMKNKIQQDLANNNNNKNNNSTGNLTDCRWIILQGWTQCSLKCGGGISTLHRMKIPAKNGGADCEGDPIVTMPCNLMPCPSLKETVEIIGQPKKFVKKTVVSVIPFSSNPLRYSKCKIKEGEFMYISKERGPGDNNLYSTYREEEKQIPTRVVMNTKTFSIFGGDDYSSLIMTFNLENSVLAISKNRTSCFMITEHTNQAVLCPISFNQADKVIDEWHYHFNLFKFQCHQDITTVDNEIDLAKKMNDEIEKVKRDLTLEEEEDNIKKAQVQEIENFAEKKNIQKDNVLRAMKKEINLEDMVKREEEEREKREEEILLKEIDAEKRKTDCLTKAIRERKRENEYNLSKKQYGEELNNMAKNAAQDVMIKRNLLKKTLESMRRKASIKENKLRQQLENVRMVLTKKMHDAYRQGSTQKCLDALESDASRYAYCVANFPDMLLEYHNCKDTNEFCPICCENEYGELFMAEREQCIQDCQGIKKESAGKSRWMYQMPVV